MNRAKGEKETPPLTPPLEGRGMPTEFLWQTKRQTKWRTRRQAKRRTRRQTKRRTKRRTRRQQFPSLQGEGQGWGLFISHRRRTGAGVGSLHFSSPKNRGRGGSLHFSSPKNRARGGSPYFSSVKSSWPSIPMPAALTRMRVGLPLLYSFRVTSPLSSGVTSGFQKSVRR